MQISKNGLDLIKSFEGLFLKAYKDPGSKDGLPITIGYGSTSYIDGSKIKLGDKITQERAEDMLLCEVNNKTLALRNMNLKLNQNQFDAIASFVYNIGISAFKKSTLYKKIIANPNDLTIANEFMRWVRNDGKVMKGLENRRRAEKDLYFK